MNSIDKYLINEIILRESNNLDNSAPKKPEKLTMDEYLKQVDDFWNTSEND